MKGLIASGKSTWASEFLKQNKNYKRVNRDYIRHCLSAYQFTDENEKLVQKVWKQVVKEILESGYNLIVDEMNLNTDTRNNNISYIKSIVPDIEIEIKNFPITLEEAIKRDSFREFKIGEKIIKRTWHKYKNELIEILEESNKPKVVYNPELPDCIISDCDATLSIRWNRSPFDYSKVKDDKLNTPIRDLVLTLLAGTNRKFFIFSGRDDSCKEDTKIWLNSHALFPDDIIMRRTGDKRADSIVKVELYKEYIEGKYNCLYWLDDRKQVIDALRQELGLTVLDVAGNTF
jgi:predicted kinase